MPDLQEQQPPRLITALDRGKYIGTVHRGILRDLLLSEGGINSEEREGFIAVILNKDDVVISSKLISIGNANTVLVSVRDTFREVVAHERWTKLVVAHNHPDGNPNPSQDDKRLTDNIKQAGRLLGVEVVDHIVVGDDSFYSFTDGHIYQTYNNVISFTKNQRAEEQAQAYKVNPANWPVQPQQIKPLTGNNQSPVSKQRERPAKPPDGFGVTWHWSERDGIWYSEPDTKTLFGRFLKGLRGF